MSKKLSVIMIVKDEEKLLARCLNSVQDADEIVILDTGSTDRTGEVARAFTTKYIADEYKWNDNFAEARNKAQAKATGDWIFVLDADEYLEPDGIQKIRDYIATLSDDIQAVDTKCVGEGRGDIHYQPRLYRNKPDEIFWKGAIHNYLNVLGQARVDIKVTYGYSPAHKRDPDRALRILKKQVATNPKCVREVFYLAREYLYRKDWITALYWYTEYLERADWAPEMAEAHLQMAQCHWYLQKADRARKACLEAINLNADFREALLFMGQMTGPINSSRWKEFSENAQNRNVLFMRQKDEKKPEYYDKVFSASKDMMRYKDIYAKVGEWCKGKTVLDIGCGTGELQHYVNSYHGFDFSEKAVEIAENKNIWNGNAYDKANYLKHKYDAFVALEVLEHVDDLKLIENIPIGAEFVFSVPSFADPAHLRTYTEETLRQRYDKLLTIYDVQRFNWSGKWTQNVPETKYYILLVKSRKR